MEKAVPYVRVGAGISPRRYSAQANRSAKPVSLYAMEWHSKAMSTPRGNGMVIPWDGTRYPKKS